MQIDELYEMFQWCCAYLALAGLAVGLFAFLLTSPFGRLMREALEMSWRRFRRLGVFGQIVVAVGLSICVQRGSAKWHPVAHGGGDDQLTVYGIYTGISNDVVQVEGQTVTNEIPMVRVEWFGNGGSAETPVSIRQSETNEWTEVEKQEPVTFWKDGVTNILEFVTEKDYCSIPYWWFGVDKPAIIVTEEGIEIREFWVTTRQVRFAFVCGEREAQYFYIQRKEQGRTDWVTVKTVPAVYGVVNTAVVDCFTVDKTYDWRIMTEIEEGGEE